MKRTNNFKSGVLCLLLSGSMSLLFSRCEDKPFEKKGIIKVIALDSIKKEILPDALISMTSLNSNKCEMTRDTTDPTNSSFILKAREKGSHGFTLMVGKDNYQVLVREISIKLPSSKGDFRDTVKVLLQPY